MAKKKKPKKDSSGKPSRDLSDRTFLIDKDRLDEEWLAQPELYYHYAVLQADARQELEEAKSDLELVKAELADSIRTDPADYGIDKVTVDAVKDAVIQQKEYKDALAYVNEKRHALDVLSAAVVALDHRKKSLENLVYLHGQNYFSTPRAIGADDEEGMKNAAKRKRKRFTRDELLEE